MVFSPVPFPFPHPAKICKTTRSISTSIVVFSFYKMRLILLEILLVASSVFAFFRVPCDVFEACASNVEYSTGPFDIVYDQENPMIKVYDGASLVWFTASSNFASAARVSENVEQNGGIFVITNTVLDTCNEMSVSNHGSAGGGTAGSQNVVYFNGTICNHTSFSLTFQAQTVTDENGTWSHLQLNLSIPDNSSYNQLSLTYGCAEDEHFYGFGAQYSKFDMKGYRLPMFLSEQGVGRGLEPLTAILDAVSKGAGMSELNYFLVLFFI